MRLPIFALLHHLEEHRRIDRRSLKACGLYGEIMGDDAVPIGITKGDCLKIKDNGTVVPLEEMVKAWNEPVWNIMGGVEQ